MRSSHVLVVAALLTTTACVSIRDRHGYVVERGETDLEAMAGIDTKESVLARYGEPSLRPAMTDDSWYYVSSSTNSRAFFQTETVDRRIIAFNFNDQGTVTSVAEYSFEDGMNIDLVSKKTPTRGKELSVIEQLLGGVGQQAGAIDPDDAR